MINDDVGLVVAVGSFGDLTVPSCDLTAVIDLDEDLYLFQSLSLPILSYILSIQSIWVGT